MSKPRLKVNLDSKLRFNWKKRITISFEHSKTEKTMRDTWTWTWMSTTHLCETNNIRRHKNKLSIWLNLQQPTTTITTQQQVFTSNWSVLIINPRLLICHILLSEGLLFNQLLRIKRLLISRTARWCNTLMSIIHHMLILQNRCRIWLEGRLIRTYLSRDSRPLFHSIRSSILL